MGVFVCFDCGSSALCTDYPLQSPPVAAPLRALVKAPTQPAAGRWNHDAMDGIILAWSHGWSHAAIAFGAWGVLPLCLPLPRANSHECKAS